MLFFGQALDSMARGLEARAQREQLDRIAAAQAARDQVRDEKFDSAMSGLHRGQFAMWVQTPDGERFEAWAEHALQASRAIDDRQDAWELAWADAQRQELTLERAQHQERLEQYVGDRFVPVKRRDRDRDKRIAILSGAAFIVMIILLAIVVSLMPREGAGFIQVLLVRSLMIMLAGGGVTAAIFGFHWVYSSRDADEADMQRRRHLEQEFVSTHSGAAKRLAPPSWHETADGARLRELSLQLGTTAAEAHKIFPRKDQLLPLAGTYRTRSDLESLDLPASAVRLLEAFRAEDVERLGRLGGAGLS